MRLLQRAPSDNVVMMSLQAASLVMIVVAAVLFERRLAEAEAQVQMYQRLLLDTDRPEWCAPRPLPERSL